MPLSEPPVAPAVSSPRLTTPSTETPPPYGDGPTPAVARVNFNTRLAPDVDAALKRATLERKLNRQSPHLIQDIVEEALRPWLVTRGYLAK